MSKKTLSGLLSVLCVLLCALVLFCACGGDDNPTETGSSEVTTNAPDAVTDPDTNEETDTTVSETVADGKVTYTITVVDQDGNPVAGVEVQMCNVDGICLLPTATNDSGIATFVQDEAVYYVTIPSCPEGYTANSETKHNFDEGSTEMTVTIEKVGAGATEETTEEITEETTEPEKYPAWDADKAVVTHQSFDQLYKGNGDSNDAANNGLDIFPMGSSAGWDKVADLTAGDTTVITYWGWVAVKGEVGTFGYQIDDNTPIYNAEWTHETGADVIGAATSNGGDTGSRMKIAIDLADLGGEHSVRVLYKSADGAEVTLNIFTVKLPLPPVVYVANDTLAILQPDLSGIQSSAYEAGGYDAWDKVVTLKKGATGGIWDMGWVALRDDVTYEFGYIISGAGSLTLFHPSYAVAATAEQIAAGQEMGGTTVTGFLGACAEAALGVGENNVKFAVRLNGDDNQIYVVREYTVILEA